MEIGTHKRPSAARVVLGKFIRLVLIVGILGGAGYLLLTDSGRQTLRRIQAKIGIGKHSDDSPAVRLLREKVPAIDRTFEDRPGAIRFDEEEQNDGSVVVRMVHQFQDTLTQASFSVHIPSGTVNPIDAEAQRLADQ